MQEIIMPDPQKWDNFVVNKFSRPRGLHAYKRTQVFSESERENISRYTKQNI